MKKFISLMLVCLMLVSFSVIGNASTSYATFTISTEKVAADSYNTNGYYKVTVGISDALVYGGESGFVGWNAIGFDLVYDAEYFDAGYIKAVTNPFTQETTTSTVWAGDSLGVTMYKSDFSVDTAMSVQSSANVVNGVSMITIAGGSTTGTFNGSALGDGTFATFYLSPKSNVYGKTTLSIGDVSFAGNAGAIEHTTFTKGTADVDFGTAPTTTYNVTTSVNDTAMGSVSVDKTTAAKDNVVTATIVPATGYQIKSVTANGTDVTASVAADNTVAVTMGEADMAIAVVFEAIPVKEAKVEAVEGGVFEINNNGMPGKLYVGRYNLEGTAPNDVGFKYGGIKYGLKEADNSKTWNAGGYYAIIFYGEEGKFNPDATVEAYME